MSAATTWWALCGLLVTLGLLTAYVGAQPVSETAPRPSSALLTRAKGAGLRLTRRERATLVVAALAGLVVAILTGWLTALLALPVASVMIPRLLRQKGDTAKIERLEALEEWTRALSGVLHARAGLTDALIATLRSTPQPIRPEVELLVARLQAHRPTGEALRAFADDLDDPAGDLIASTLILGASQSGAGLTKILTGLASAVSDEVRVRRQIEADRAGPRAQARWMIVIATLGMAGFLALTPYGQSYSDPLGQGILAIILAAFFGCLMWMHWVTVTRPEPRFLVSTTEVGQR